MASRTSVNQTTATVDAVQERSTMAGIAAPPIVLNPSTSTDSDSDTGLKDYLAKDTDRSHMEDIDRGQSVPQSPQESTATHPEPQIIKTGYEPERTLLQTYYLTAREPGNPVEPHIKLELYLENCRRDCEMLVELLTNNDSIAFVCQVVISYFGEGYGIYGCDRL